MMGFPKLSYPALTTTLRCILWLGFTRVTSKQTECIFYEGATFVTVCEKGCCDNKCCEDTNDSTPLVAGVGVGLFVLVAIVIIAVVCFTKSRWKNSRCRRRKEVDVEDSDDDQPHPGTSSNTGRTST